MFHLLTKIVHCNKNTDNERFLLIHGTIIKNMLYICRHEYNKMFKLPVFDDGWSSKTCFNSSSG